MIEAMWFALYIFASIGGAVVLAAAWLSFWLWYSAEYIREIERNRRVKNFLKRLMRKES